MLHFVFGRMKIVNYFKHDQAVGGDARMNVIYGHVTTFFKTFPLVSCIMTTMAAIESRKTESHMPSVRLEVSGSKGLFILATRRTNLKTPSALANLL